MVSLANLEWSWRKIIVDHLSFSRNMGHTIVLYQLCVEVVVFLLVVGVASKLGKYVKVLCFSMCFEKDRRHGGSHSNVL
jgi:hypothetical protein